MNSVIQLGPLALNGTVILFVIAWSVSLALVRLLSNRLSLRYEQIRRLVDGAIITGLVSSRLVFVVQFWDVFKRAPWEALFFWHGGFSLWGGILGAILFLAGRCLYTKTPEFTRQSAWAALVLALIAGIFVASHWLTTRSQPQARSTPLVNFELTDMSDLPVSLEQFKGKPLVINFWATWCPPCRREMPLLEDSYTPYMAEGITIITINVGEDGNTIQNYLAANNLTLPVLKSGKHNTNVVFDYFGGQVMPTTLFIDAKGVVQSSKVGELSAATLRRGISDISS